MYRIYVYSRPQKDIPLENGAEVEDDAPEPGTQPLRSLVA